MVAKVVLLFCAQALLIQSIAGQCIGAGWMDGAYGGYGALAGAPCGAAGPYGAPWANAGFYGADGLYGAAGLYGADLVATPAFSGGALPVASASAIPPSGVSVLSENAYAGELAVRGALPFLGTVGLEGALPTAGAGAVAYGCGNGDVAMLTEGIGAAGIAGPLGYGAAIGPFGAGYGAAIGPFGAGYGYGYGYDGLAGPAFGLGGCGCGRLI